MNSTQRAESRDTRIWALGGAAVEILQVGVAKQLFNEVTRTEIQPMTHWMGHLNEEVNYLINSEPEISALLSLILNKIYARKAVIDRLSTSLALNSTDLISIGQLATPKIFGRIHPKDANLNKIHYVGKGITQIVVSGPTRSSSTDVFQVNALDYISREKEQYYRNKYSGKQWPIRNNTSNCVKAIEPTIARFVRQECTTPNWRDSKLKQWSKVPTSKNSTVASTYYEAWPFIIIQCWLQNISVTQPIKKNIRCPMRPIALNASWSFTTTEKQIVHSGQFEIQEDKILDIEINIEDNHQEEQPEIQQEDEMETIIQEKKQTEEKFVAISMGDTKVNYKHTTFGLGSIMCCIFIFLVLKSIRNSWRAFLDRIVPRQYVRTNNLDVYETQLQRVQRRRSSRGTQTP